MKNKFLKLMALFVASAFAGSAGAQTDVTPYFADGDYLIVNTETGCYLGGGNDWGTHASLLGKPQIFTFAHKGSNAYTLDSHQSNGGNSHFLSTGLYCDGAAADWTFAETIDGCYTISNNGNYLAGNGANNVIVSVTDAAATAAKWTIISKAEAIAALNAATAATPVDATFYISNPECKRNAGGWTNKAANGSDNSKDLSMGSSDQTANCSESYRSENGFDMSQVLVGLKPGLYRLDAHAFYRNDGDNTGVFPYIYVNEQQSRFPERTGSENSMAAAYASFLNGEYAIEPIYFEVAEGDEIKIGAHGENTMFWNIWGEFGLAYYGTLLKHDAVAFTSGMELAANVWYSYNVAQDTEFNIVAGTDLNNITYIISDGAILTEEADANAKDAFASTQTLTAGTYYFKSSTAQTLSITPNVLPTIVTLTATEIALNAASNTVELTATVGEAGAPQDIVWTSTNANVATVVNGVVTGVTPGTTVVRATAYGYDDVYAEATVTVTYPETVVPESEYVNDGAKRSYYIYEDNLIKNGSFEYPNGFYGWLAANNSALSSSKFEIVTDGDNKYLKAKTHGGSTDAGSIGTGWAIETGKTYVFGYRVKGGSAGNSEFHKVTLTNSLGTETKQISDNATPVTTDWTYVIYKFTNTDGYKYLQFRARWLNSNTEFDDFYLCEVNATEEVGNVDYITENVPTANIGEGAFQYSQTNIDAAKSLVQGEATVEDVQNAYDAMMALNAPTEDEAFNLVLKYVGWTYDGKAATYIENGRSDAGLYNIQYLKEPNANYAQAFTFIPVEGQANCYTLSMTDVDGNERYISTGVPHGGNTAQIRTTTDATKALVVKVIATPTDGIWNLLNTEANNYIGSQDAGVFTVNSHIDFALKPAAKAEVTLKVTDLGWATLMLPFNAEIPTGLEVWSCTGEEDGVLTLEAVKSIAANTPYVVSGEVGEYTFADYGLAKQDAYAGTMFTGTYAETLAPVGSYVLQNGANGFGFYKVADGKQPTVGAYRCYINASESAAPMFSLERGEGTTSIEDAELTNETVVIYDLAGRRVEKMEKGIYIVNGKKVIR